MITYDSTNILDNIQITRFVQHESVADYDINSLKPSRSDGVIFVSEVLGIKKIIIEGVINGTSQANLETNIDTFNELMNRKNKNLDISYAGGTRRYVCIPESIVYDRDHFNLLFVPFRIVMQVPSGFGKNTSSSTLTAKTLTAVTTTDALTFEGSAIPKPIIKVTVNTRGNGDVVRIENTDNDDYIDIDLKDFIATDYVEVDCENLTVLKNGTTEINYRGKFPQFESGVNNIKYTVFGSSGWVVANQEQTSYPQVTQIYSSTTIPESAQSFIPSQSGISGKVELRLRKTGSPGGVVYVSIYDDNNNKPGSLKGSSSDVTLASITGIQYVSFEDIPSYIVAGQKYWLVLRTQGLTGSDDSNSIDIYSNTDASSYLKGKAMAKQSSSGSYTDGVADSDQASNILAGQFDLYFKAFLGDGNSPSFNLSAQATYTKKYL